MANAVAGRQAPPVAPNRLSLWVWDGSVSPCAAEVQCCSSCGTRVHYTMHVPQGKMMHGRLSSAYRDERVWLARMRHCMSRPPAPLVTYCKSEYIRGLHAGGWVACPRDMGEQKYLSGCTLCQAIAKYLCRKRYRLISFPTATEIATVQGHGSIVIRIAIGFLASMNLKIIEGPT